MAADLWMRALHILFAALWVGGGIYRGVIVERLMLKDRTFADRFFASSLHGPFMGITATLAVIFGSIALVMGSGEVSRYDMDALGDGFFLFHGALGFAMIAFALGLVGHMPTDARLKPIAAAKMAGEDYDEARYASLARREAVLGRLSGILMVLALVGMTTFRAVGA